MFLKDIFVLSISCYICCHGIDNFRTNQEKLPEKLLLSKYIKIDDYKSYVQTVGLSQVYLGINICSVMLAKKLNLGKNIMALLGLAFVIFFSYYCYRMFRIIEINMNK